MKEYIKSNCWLNKREICRIIEWSPSSFSQWLHHDRPIPKKIEKKLKEFLLSKGKELINKTN